MVKNFPLLLSMLLIGNSALIISLTTPLPELLHWVLLIIAAVFNIWSAIGLMLHAWVQKVQMDIENRNY
ncbi:hypothetical protein F3157_13960 [Virgibacillus dakarensis]|uniref:Uncharacterized protein n=1 Tax=Lentibacillus populi TaxID=1827502 RepID=A0A9W5X5C7_9BACI|nr:MULTISPECIES: hypothetical protein [Bacillaceae]MBT2217308.1 hypothetical protein [Virgibacillus dakarensis]MTW86758.1 hypothetical protein [Virgibacillus dakarensis]GGB38133.1 hypothetical protein GCM10011409_14510 [Lentibacillus populi]